MWALIGLLSAASAQNFTVHGTVVSPVDNTYYANGVGAPAVAYDPGRDLYVMLFETKIPDNGTWFDSNTFSACPGGVRVWGLGRATSSDGLNWTVDATPALLPTANTDWGCVVAHPVLVFDGTTWHVWYKAHDATGQTGIGYASSTDGATFTHHSSLVLSGAALSFPAVVQVDGVWTMLATVAPNLHLGTSTDGLSWTMDLSNPVIAPGDATWMPYEVYNPSLTCNDSADAFNLFVGGRDYADRDGSGQIEVGNSADMVSVNFGAAASADASTWAIDTDEILQWDLTAGAQDWRHWDAMRVGNHHLVYFAQKQNTGGTLKNHIGLAYSVPTNPANPSWNEGAISDRICVRPAVPTDTDTDSDTDLPDETDVPDDPKSTDDDPDPADTAPPYDDPGHKSGPCFCGTGARGSVAWMLVALAAVRRR